MSDNPYSSGIQPLRLPDIGRHDDGSFTSTWHFVFIRDFSSDDLEAVSAAVTEQVADVSLVSASYGVSADLTFLSAAHPFQAEMWLPFAQVLRLLDERIGILTINGDPKLWWRPFRPAAGDE